jgi:predicted nucleic acid-binding Zn ribbon protein
MPRRSGGKGKSPVHVGVALASVTRSLGIDRRLSEYQVITAWEAIVGEQIAKVTRPERIERGVLFVAVSSAPWRAELTMRRRELLEAVNKKAGRRLVKEIRFR